MSKKPSLLKMSDELYGILWRGFSTFFTYWVEAGKADVVEQTIQRGTDTEKIRWSIYWAINDDLKYDDTHPRYVGGTDYRTGNPIPAKVRIVQHDPRYAELKSLESLTDNQIDNALKAIFKALEKDF